VNGCLVMESETVMEIKKASFGIERLVSWLNIAITIIAIIDFMVIVKNLRLLFENEDLLENE